MFFFHLSGISSVCGSCFEVHKKDPLLHEFQCFQSKEHDYVQWICVTWDKPRSQWMQIRQKPNYIPKGKYGLCAMDERCSGENCTFAHSKLEHKAWNHELRRRRNSVSVNPGHIFVVWCML